MQVSLVDIESAVRIALRRTIGMLDPLGTSAEVSYRINNEGARFQLSTIEGYILVDVWFDSGPQKVSVWNLSELVPPYKEREAVNPRQGDSSAVQEPLSQEDLQTIEKVMIKFGILKTEDYPRVG